MSHKDTIASYIYEHKGSYCDDCLSKLCNINPRQAVFQVCSKLSIEGKINRGTGICSSCGKQKKVSSGIDEACKDNMQIDETKKIRTNKNNAIFMKPNEKFIYNRNKFIELKLEFENFDIKDTFSRLNSHTLAEIFTKDKYIKLKYECERNYINYMCMELGKFVNMLKKDNNYLYKRFLNPYGDQLFCKFKMEETPFAKLKGLYMFKYNEQIKYIGRVKGNFNFYQRINAGYANISPKNCYIDGQATNCHINAIINKFREQVRFYIMPLEDDETICSLERILIEENQPDWNIALK